MTNWYDQRRTLGTTGLYLPRIVFGTAALGNVERVMTDQAKIALCGEFLRLLAPPVWIETSYAYGDGMALEVLGRALRKLDVTGDEVELQLTIDARHVSSIAECWERSCRLLGDARPKLIAIGDADEGSWRVANDLKSAGEVRGIGLVASDWRCVKDSLTAFEPDWVMLRGCTVMRHAHEILEFMSELAMNQIPIVLSGVFEGGFLVGANQLGGRTLRTEEASDRSPLAWRKAFVALCDGHGVSPSHACIRFALTAPGVDAVRLETSFADRVVQNINSLRQKVPESFWEAMKEEGLLSESVVLLRIRRFGKE
jgi:D-threo-aldose 1-dehydrogenase